MSSVLRMPDGFRIGRNSFAYLADEGGGQIIVMRPREGDRVLAMQEAESVIKSHGVTVDMRDVGTHLVFTVREKRQRSHMGRPASPDMDRVRNMQPGDEVYVNVASVKLQSLRNMISQMNHGSLYRRSVTAARDGEAFHTVRMEGLPSEPVTDPAPTPSPSPRSSETPPTPEQLAEAQAETQRILKALDAGEEPEFF